MSGKDEMDRAHYWKWGIGGAVLLFIAAMATTMVYSVRHGTRVVDTDYYEHGLHYDARHSPVHSGAAAGWRAELACAAGRLRLRLSDDTGTPVSGATVTFTPVNVTPTGLLSLKESAPGTYASSPLPDSCTVTGTITAVRGTDTLRRRVTVLR